MKSHLPNVTLPLCIWLASDLSPNVWSVSSPAGGILDGNGSLTAWRGLVQVDTRGPSQNQKPLTEVALSPF